MQGIDLDFLPSSYACRIDSTEQREFLRILTILAANGYWEKKKYAYKLQRIYESCKVKSLLSNQSLLNFETPVAIYERTRACTSP